MTSKPRFRRGLSHLVPKYDVDALPDAPNTDILQFLDEHIRYQPRRSEAHIIARIESAVDGLLDGLFSEADSALEALYRSVRVVEGYDEDGMPIWRRDDEGAYVEDWSLVDGMDLERTIMALQRVIIAATEEVGKLYMRALFAQHVKDDEYWDAYRSVIDGTINDRTAAAYRATKDSRYYYFYVYWLWKRASDLLEAYKNTKKDLEFMRSRLLKDPTVVDIVPGRMRDVR